MKFKIDANTTWSSSCKIALLLLVLSSGYCNAQKNPKRFYLPRETQKRTVIPFEVINNLIVIKAYVNNSDTLNFILDTGVSTTLLNSAILKPGSEKDLRELIVNGPGVGSGIVVKYSAQNTIKIGRVTGDCQDILLIDDADFKLSQLLGIEIHGIIGYEVLKDFIVEINYNTHHIAFNRPKYYHYKPASAKRVTIPLIFDNEKPQIEAKISHSGSPAVTIKLLVDLGASYSLLLNSTNDPAIKLPERNLKTLLGVGLTGEIYGRIAKIDTLYVGNFKFNNVFASFPEINPAFIDTSSNDRNGSLGADILSRFNLIIDYRGQSITLIPNMNFRKPFLYNMSGLEIAAFTNNMRRYRVSYVRENSPAFKAGVRENDEILEINNRNTSEMSLSDIIGILQQKEGRKIYLKYIRKDKEQLTNFVSEDYLK